MALVAISFHFSKGGDYDLYILSQKARIALNGYSKLQYENIGSKKVLPIARKYDVKIPGI
jgi:hypothetical protein